MLEQKLAIELGLTIGAPNRVRGLDRSLLQRECLHELSDGRTCHKLLLDDLEKHGHGVLDLGAPELPVEILERGETWIWGRVLEDMQLRRDLIIVGISFRDQVVQVHVGLSQDSKQQQVVGSMHMRTPVWMLADIDTVLVGRGDLVSRKICIVRIMHLHTLHTFGLEISANLAADLVPLGAGLAGTRVDKLDLSLVDSW